MTYVHIPPTAYRIDISPIRLYFNKDEFLKFLEKFRERIILTVRVRKRGIMVNTNIYIAFCKEFVAICRTPDPLPIEVDVEATNVKGLL